MSWIFVIVLFQLYIQVTITAQILYDDGIELSPIGSLQRAFGDSYAARNRS